MRGSNEIIHNADIGVIVVNGLATTHKNRFKEKYDAGLLEAPSTPDNPACRRQVSGPLKQC
jgi:hypothetical protein